VRYSGAPFPMSARELTRGPKCVVLVEMEGSKLPQGKPSVTELPVPAFQEFAYICGDMETLSLNLTELRLRNEEIWAEVVY
jgi:DNA repair exonuclease SbcCD nuclease subunit